MRLIGVAALCALGLCACEPNRGQIGTNTPSAQNTCGNGKLDDGEKCDPEIAEGPGACPTSCDDATPCTQDLLKGSAEACSAACEHVAVTACEGGDGCCPAGCNGTSDADCSTCADECPRTGNLRCDQNAVVTCGNFDGDSCLEWGPATPCESGQSCNAGKCEATCVSDCTSVGAKRCDETGAVVVCGDSDGHGCLKWGAASRCPATQVCSNGDCAATCSNECPNTGDKRCVAGSTTQFETCGNFDSDSCLEWGNAQNCGTNLVCSNGSCASTCTDGCASAGTRQCQNNGVVSCGDFNRDGCLEWGTATSCANSETCTSGACQANPAPSRVLINEVVYDSAGSPDTESFVELYGPAGSSLTGFKLVGVNGNGGATYNEIALVGNIGPDGYFVVAHPSGSAGLKAQADQLDAKVDYQNGPDSIQLRWGTTVVDAIGYGTFGASDVFAGEGHAVKGVVATGHSLGRNLQHADTNDNSADFKDRASTTPGASNEATTATCGNGVVEAGETCDGNCPTGCNDSNACTTDALTGSAASCNAACTHQAVTQCKAGDGCCAPGCNSTTDSDCSASCGNGVVEPPEKCDGNCPTSCSDGNACTTDSLSGSAAQCSATCTHQSITQCIGGDGCCAAGCNATTDSDCSASCGNGAVEAPETCDGNCPTSCNDANACTIDAMTGSAALCSAACSHQTITQCKGGDGCCAAGCNANSDSDCSATCGNGVVEATETCDGNCPTSCNDNNACTADALTGSAAACSASCSHQSITQCQSGDGCCPSGCNAGNDNDCTPVCTDQCSADQTDCANGQLRTCTTNASGCKAWGTATACVQGSCASPTACGYPSMTISTNTELCGEKRYSRFVIQGGAKVTCATGELTVWADDVLIDPASSIDVSGTSTVTSGGNSGYCNDSLCPYQDSWTGAGGGGNATAGAKAVDSYYVAAGDPSYHCYGSTVRKPCAGGSGGGKRGDPSALDGSLGGAGGNSVDWGNGTVVPGGKGGGSVRLFGTRSITVQGAILAKGSDGATGVANGPVAGSGGGAGGSIVLGASSLSVTGTLATNPGRGGLARANPYAGTDARGGDGGQGYVKLLYGTSFTNTASVSGATPIGSFMPPVDVASSTHPDPTLAYNDTFGSLSLSWLAPYSGAQGYWTRLSGDLVPVTPANATYTTGLTATYPATSFPSSGQGFFSVVTSDASAGAGALANRFRIAVNSLPHVVASSSHPASTNWYPGTAIALSWTPPTGTGASSFPAFWYRLDRTSNTSPANAKTEWTRTTNGQVTLTQDWQNQPVNGFAYYFHLVSEDTRGNLTKAAAHFLVQVGTAPAKTSFFGYVRDHSSAAVSGATVVLEPYGLSATTDANGYFLLQNVWQGTYAATVSKVGYTTSTTSVNVSAAASPWSVTLSP